MAAGLQVLTETVCSLIFNLQHHWTQSLWSCCQTIECSIPASRHSLPGGKSATLGLFHFFTHAKAY